MGTTLTVPTLRLVLANAPTGMGKGQGPETRG